MFLAKYKMMVAENCKMIYKSKDYYRKRLKVLENNKYIRRINRIYIKLDNNGTKLVKEFGYDYTFNCRKPEYINRLQRLARIASLTIDSNIKFVASWDLKSSNAYTENSRNFLGELSVMNEKRIIYYISKSKQSYYIKQVKNDIRKLINYSNIIVFVDDNSVIENLGNFVFGKDSLLLIEENNENLNILRKLDKIDKFKLIDTIYFNNEILLSNWKFANFMTIDRNYIIFMPFIDTERLYALNLYLKNNPYIKRNVDIITLKGNEKYIENSLADKVNIILLDTWLGGLDEIEVKI